MVAIIGIILIVAGSFVTWALCRTASVADKEESNEQRD